MCTKFANLAGCILLGLSLTGATTAFAQDVNFGAKTISVYAAGGGYSLYARTLAMHIGKKLPGEPTVVVKELPGAGTLMSANYISEAAKKDGTEIAAVGGSVATVQLYKTPSIRFDPRNFVWLGSISSEAGVAAATEKSGITSIQQVLERKMLVGGSAPPPETWFFRLCQTACWAHVSRSYVATRARRKLPSPWNAARWKA